MMVSQWLKVNTFRALSTLPLIGLSALAILSTAVGSEARAVARAADVRHANAVHLHHIDIEGGAQHFDALQHFNAAHHSDAAHLSDLSGASEVRHANHVERANHEGSAHDADSTTPNAKDASHVARVFDWTRMSGGGAADASIPHGVDTNFVRKSTGIDIYGAAKDWHALAAHYGYYVSDKPVAGGAVCFEGGAYGTSAAYGFVGVVVYYKDHGNYWEVGASYAYPTEGGGYHNSHVRERAFRVSKNDPKAHYIYRNGMYERPDGYYSHLEYSGYNVVGKQYALSAQMKEVVVYSEDGHAKAYVGPNQVVRVLAKAEPGETLWVFVETPYRARTVYAMTYYDGKKHLGKFEASSPGASRMYYAKNYGDTVLDLGYADYSEIAGDSREVTITIKKGVDPMRLQRLQAVRLQLAGK